VELLFGFIGDHRLFAALAVFLFFFLLLDDHVNAVSQPLGFISVFSLFPHVTGDVPEA